MLVFLQSNPANAGAQVIFNLPLTDAGAGIVNTTPTASAGSPTPTFTRATVAWTKLSTGLWAQVASGQPRSCYIGANTAVGTYGGYLGEAAGTQLVTPDASIRDMTDASWVAVNVTPAKTATGIDGVVNSASTLTSGAIGGAIQQTLVAAASSRTYSCWIRRVSGTGTITINQGATTSDITAQINSTTYTRVTLTASVLNAAFGITFGASGDVIEVDFNQFEAGAIATSPMATAGAARNADALSYVGTGNLLPTQGTCYTECQQNNPTQAFTLIDTGGSECQSFGPGLKINDGTNQAATGTPTAAVVNKLGTTWGGLGIRACLNGAAPVNASFDGAIGVTPIAIITAGQTKSCTIKNMLIYNQQLSNAALQALTT